MNIWLVTVGEPLPADSGTPRLLRTGIVAEMLAGLGHQVVWWTSTFDHLLKRQRADHDTSFEWKAIRIQMLRSSGYPRNLSLRRFIEHEGVARKFRKIAVSAPRPDIILCSLPTIELAREAVRYGKRQGVPVLLDIRDLWPDVFFDALPKFLRWSGGILFFWLSNQARWALTNSTGIIGISEGYLAWGLRLAKRDRYGCDAVLPIGYKSQTPSAQVLDAAAIRLKQLGVESGKLICWFVGSFSRQFDFGPVLAAARQMQDQCRDNVQFVLSGQGDLWQSTREQAQGLKNVVFTDWIDANDIAWFRAHAAIGLQPYAEDSRMGLANKLFEYLSAGIPTISSLKGENAALLQTYDCGLTYSPTDSRDLSAKLELLIDNEQLRTEMGMRGRRAFEERYSAEAVYSDLCKHLATVVELYRCKQC